MGISLSIRIIRTEERRSTNVLSVREATPAQRKRAAGNTSNKVGSGTAKFDSLVYVDCCLFYILCRREPTIINMFSVSIFLFVALATATTPDNVSSRLMIHVS